MKRRLSIASIVTGAVLILAGCSAGPTDDEIEERFAIELAGVFGGDKDDPAMREFAVSLSEHADEDCKNPTLWRLVSTGDDDVRWEPWMLYVHAASCSVLYGDAIDEDLREDYKRVILEHVTESLDE